MAYRLGWVLYWACLGLAIVLVAVWVLRFFTDLAPLPLLIQVLFSGFRRSYSTNWSSLPVRAGR